MNCTSAITVIPNYQLLDRKAYTGVLGLSDMARDTPVSASTAATDQSPSLPNLVTIIGRGVPANFEISVAGELEMVDEDPSNTATIVSGGVAEGAIDVGVRRFRFSGELVNVRVVDWNGETAPVSKSVPNVHVDYGVTN